MNRRLAAILAADIAGYSALMGADHEGTMVALRRFWTDILEPAVAARNGTVVKAMGDGWLVEFVSAADAVAAAIEIQAALAGQDVLMLRIGIHIGDVTHEDGDIYGDGVNLAARLEALATPGTVAVSDPVWGALDGAARSAFVDRGEQALKNIDRPVRVWSTGPLGGSSAGAGGTGSERATIAVLPFRNLSNDVDQEYFADGIAEDITTALGHFHWFLVIARATSFTYKGSDLPLPDIARELAVRYVVQGSVRKAGGRVRVTAQLIDAGNGAEIWAQRYDGELTDIFEVQDQITQAIVGEIAPSFTGAEAVRAARKAPESLGAWDATMRGNWHLWRLTQADVAEARRLFRHAIDLDPASSTSWSGLAMASLMENNLGFAAIPEANLEEAQEAARRAIAFDDRNAWPHVALAMVDHARRDNARALESCARAVALNPNLALAFGLMGLQQAHVGAADEARRNIEYAIRLSPRDPTAPFWRLGLVISALVADRPDEYVARARELTRAFPELVAGWRHLAAAAACAGEPDQAVRALAEVRRQSPGDRVGLLARTVPISDTAARERYLDGLRRAGLPD